MPAELQVIRASEFVCLDPDEHLDFEASKKELQKLVQACRKRGLNCALLDLRGLPILPKPHFTTAEVAELVGAVREAGFGRQQRLAILYEHDLYGIIRNFTFFSRLRGLQVQAYLNYEEATSWLAGKVPPPAEHRLGDPIPIAKREAKKHAKKPAARTPRAGISRLVRKTRKNR